MRKFTKCRAECKVKEGLNILACYGLSPGKESRTFRVAQTLHLEGQAIRFHGAVSFGSKLLTDY
jgi:hypothetical protein